MRTIAPLLAVLLLGTEALAAPLSSAVYRLDPDVPVVVVETTVGKSVEARFRHGQKNKYGNALPANKPLSLIVRLPRANHPDRTKVLKADRKGKRIELVIEEWRFTGTLTRNVATSPFVEISLGSLPPGSYRARIARKVHRFGDLKRPNVATSSQVLQMGTWPITVR